MGCRSNKHSDCVCDVVRAIADAQEDVIENVCDVSCERSIQDLLGPVATNGLDTVPFILYCEGDCEPFKATGVEIDKNGGDPEFVCFESFIFRVKEVDDDCCAVLELLVINENQNPGNDPCAQVGGKKVEDLERTGICITVDLNCFCGITCLPAVDLF